MINIKKLIFIAFIFLPSSLVYSEIFISSITLEQSKININKKTPYTNASNIEINSKNKLVNLYRIAIKLRNNSNQAISGIVLKYSISPYFKNKNNDVFPTISYISDEIRIPNINSNKDKIVYIYQLNINDILRQIKGTNFEIDKLKIEVFQEPKKNDLKLEVFSNIIPVIKK